jgi:predicted secreted hydrolase
MGLSAHRRAPWLAVGAAATLALLGAGPVSSASATTTQAGSGSAAACASSALPSPTLASPAAIHAAATGAQAPVQLPQDEGPHQFPQEWWYFSGHLWGADPAGHLHCYGYEFVTFQFLAIAPQPVYFEDFAVTDLTAGTFQFDLRQDSFPVPNTPGSFALHAGDWSMSGASGKDTLHAALSAYTLDLQLQTTKPAALHGTSGVIPFGPLGTSDYYSWTSLLTSGTMIDHGVPVKVAGLSWMDRQWGAFNLASGAGWDWFSVQLADGRQYMLYFIRDKSGTVVQTDATQVDRTGKTTNLDPSTFSETTTGSFTSPTSGIKYGSGWQLTVPGGSLTITPDQVNQELNLLSTQGVAYWEGDVAVRGVIGGSPVVGVGYTEINPFG